MTTLDTLSTTHLIYLSSPYSHPDASTRRFRYLDAMEAVAKLAHRGYHVVSPILHCHDLAEKFSLPTDHLFWREFNEKLMTACSLTLVLKLHGWDASQGVSHEINFTTNVVHHPVHYIHLEDL